MVRRRIAAVGTLILLLAGAGEALTPRQQEWVREFFRPLRRWRVDRSNTFGREKLPELNRPVNLGVHRGNLWKLETLSPKEPDLKIQLSRKEFLTYASVRTR